MKPKRRGVPADPGTEPAVTAWWSVPAADLMRSLGSGPSGLDRREASSRARRQSGRMADAESGLGALGLFAAQFRSPLVLILVFASIISLVAREWVDAGVVLTIVLGSAILGFTQEYMAGNAIRKLRARVHLTTTVVREGQAHTVPSSRVLPGDVVLLSAGSLVPADGVVLEARDFFLSEAVLTGETFPVEKRPGESPAASGLGQRSNCVFMGTSVRNGTARMLAVQTGAGTEYGRIAGRLAQNAEPTSFERGVQGFGYLLTQVMLAIVVLVLATNILLSRPAIDSLLFSLALAVGLTPELLPAILSITLSHGAARMAQLGVIVRRLNAIENLGSMDVLCTDKTGTLTAGVVRLDAAMGIDGEPRPEVLRLAAVNASLQSGLPNALDEAVSAAGLAAGIPVDPASKLDEIPYDFVRKCLSVVATVDDAPRLITKGALDRVLERCSTAAGTAALDEAARIRIRERFDAWSAEGFRVLGVASAPVSARAGPWRREDEHDLCFEGFLLFMDPPKPDARRTLQAMAGRGIAFKIITGDNLQVARHVAQGVGLARPQCLTGRALAELPDDALPQVAARTDVFAEVDPNQKERIILALQRAGHVVGYMGDGINDALALHTADVGISVDTAVDVAKDAADFVLLRKDLGVLLQGIDEGRRTFANTLKYILTTISANFGNMFSMAVASVFLPFLPLLASQILLNNFLSDIPAAAIASDRVDEEWLARPQRWNTLFIRNYMIVFGLLSSAFDLLTFAALLWLFQAAPAEFRTGWFLESLLTELAVALVVRTRRPFWRSRPGRMLWVSTLAVALLAIALPFVPGAALFGFVPLPVPLLLSLLALTLGYVAAVELGKQVFYRRLAASQA